ncbi:tyrosine-type recombinase/integrase [Planctomicrobium sp. SH661]|uniref:tyrosine-type recombinase/integrase n=1 Tax=Planctomicrobium sp. SH661 TaxID=3448124 RepID=UPI003F5B983C
MYGKPPKMRWHKPSNRAYVFQNGKRKYLGIWNTPESRQAYRDLVSRLHGSSVPYNTAVQELCEAFLTFAAEYYSAGELSTYRSLLRLLEDQFGALLTCEFSPLKLKRFREGLMIRHCRKQLNLRIHRIRRVFRWGAENELVPGQVVTDLACVSALRAGRSTARESEPVKPASAEAVKAAIAFMTSPVAAMVQLQLLTGMRPGEVRLLRREGLNTSGDVWNYQPSQHKNLWRGKTRIILFGPQSQEILKPFLITGRCEYLFNPQSGRAEFTRLNYREGAGAAVRNGKANANKPYTTHGYISSVYKACDRAGVERWSPNQLRHNAATMINQAFGDIDASRVVLGHSEKSTTEIYAERDLGKAIQIIREIG